MEECKLSGSNLVPVYFLCCSVIEPISETPGAGEREPAALHSRKERPISCTSHFLLPLKEAESPPLKSAYRAVSPFLKELWQARG